MDIVKSLYEESALTTIDHDFDALEEYHTGNIASFLPTILASQFIVCAEKVAL